MSKEFLSRRRNFAPSKQTKEMNTFKNNFSKILVFLPLIFSAQTAPDLQELINAGLAKNHLLEQQKLETKYTETFDNIRYDNLEINSGLGLVKNVIIDQHFLKRSRYNRLLTGLVDFPNHIGIGIDESTAIVVRDKTVEVVGESEVIVVKNPKEIKKAPKNHLVSIKSLEMSVLIEGQKFNIQ